LLRALESMEEEMAPHLNSGTAKRRRKARVILAWPHDRSRTIAMHAAEAMPKKRRADAAIAPVEAEEAATQQNEVEEAATQQRPTASAVPPWRVITPPRRVGTPPRRVGPPCFLRPKCPAGLRPKSHPTTPHCATTEVPSTPSIYRTDSSTGWTTGSSRLPRGLRATTRPVRWDITALPTHPMAQLAKKAMALAAASLRKRAAEEAEEAEEREELEELRRHARNKLMRQERQLRERGLLPSPPSQQ
jgi:hypothetical protein